MHGLICTACAEVRAGPCPSCAPGDAKQAKVIQPDAKIGRAQVHPCFKTEQGCEDKASIVVLGQVNSSHAEGISHLATPLDGDPAHSARLRSSGFPARHPKGKKEACGNAGPRWALAIF